jgi:hypothetical protein
MMQTFVRLERVTDAGGRSVYVTEAYDPPVPGATQVFANWPDCDPIQYSKQKVTINWLIPDGFVPEWLTDDAPAGDLSGGIVMESRSFFGRRRARRLGT